MGERKSDVMVGRGSFLKLVEDLQRRGFSQPEKEGAPRAPVMREGYPIATLAKEVSGFKLTVEGFDSIEGIMGNGGPDPERPVRMKIRYEAQANANLDLMLQAYRGKSHYRSGEHYVASMVPGTDAGSIIGDGLRLEEAVRRIRIDNGISEALDAREILENVSRSLEEASQGNSLKALAISYVDGLLTSLRGIYEGALGRVSRDPALREAMDAVADRD